MTPPAKLDQTAIVSELARAWLDGLAGAEEAEGRQLLVELVGDWAREADPQPNPQAVLRFQREDLEGLRAGKGPPQRLQALRGVVLGRQVDRVSADAFALGKAVVDRQYDLKRLADIAIDLFVGLSTLSRAATLEAGKHPQAAQAVSIAALFAQAAKRRMAGNVRRMTRNEDAALDALAGFMLERGSYPWDVL